MDTTNYSLAEYQSRYNDLVKTLQNFEAQQRELKAMLASAIKDATVRLDKRMNRKLARDTWEYLPEYWQSLELFAEKLKAMQAFLQQAEDTAVHIGFETETEDVDQWADAVEDMEDLTETYSNGKAFRPYFIQFLELLDSVDRISAIKLPRKFRKYLRTIKKIRNLFIETLAKHNVERIDLQPGTYPLPETTRIISRMDDKTDDNVIIIEIVSNGYMWQDKLLRKADVIVISSEGA